MRSTLDLKARLEIYEFLKTVTTKTEDGFAEYKYGLDNKPWDDDKVAERLGVKATNVSSVRVKLIGRLRAERGTENTARLDNFEQRLRALEDYAASKWRFIPKR